MLFTAVETASAPRETKEGRLRSAHVLCCFLLIPFVTFVEAGRGGYCLSLEKGTHRKRFLLKLILITEKPNELERGK